MFPLNSRHGSSGEEPFDSFVSKASNRHAYECNLYGYRPQPARPGGPGVRELRSMDQRLPVVSSRRGELASFPQGDLTGQFVPDLMRWRGESLKTMQDHSAQ